jgi:hypothetical protein
MDSTPDRHDPRANATASGSSKGEPMTDMREPFGRRLREIWVKWASEQPDPKPSWLLPWDELDEGQREVDMRMGAALWHWGFDACMNAMEASLNELKELGD